MREPSEASWQWLFTSILGVQNYFILNDQDGCKRCTRLRTKIKAAPGIQELGWFYPLALGVVRSWHWHAELGLLNINDFIEWPVSKGHSMAMIDQSKNKITP